MTMNQKEEILNYIDRWGSITPMQAFKDLGITKLSTRISELQSEDGIKFKKEPIHFTTRLGRKSYYYRYSRGE